jgi:hypothetical protein
MGGGVENLLAVGVEETAGGASLAGRDHALVAAIDIHGENLIALHVAVGRLEDQLLAVGGEVGLGVLATKGELVDVAQMFFLRRGEVRSLGGNGLPGGDGDYREKDKWRESAFHGTGASVAKREERSPQRTRRFTKEGGKAKSDLDALCLAS